MAKLILKTQFGTISDSKKVFYEITGLEKLNNDEEYNISFENVTHSVIIDSDEGKYLDLKIPSHFSQNAISIFAYIYIKNKNNKLRLKEICPSIFYLREKINIKKDLYIDPLFISPKDICNIKTTSKPYTKTIFSINDKRLKVIANEEGNGSIHFVGKDILDKDRISSVQKFPVYFYSEEDNYVKKNFSGSYVTVLPQEIATYADLDPRCDGSVTNWEIPATCVDTTDDDIAGDGTIISPTIPPVDIPVSNREMSIIVDKCRIHNGSVTSINNGMVLHVYITVDDDITDTTSDRYNINRIYILKNKTTLDVPIVINRDVIIAPKMSTEGFEIHVEEDIYNAVSDITNPSVTDLYVLFYNNFLGYQSVRIIGRRIDEYTGDYIIITEVGNTNVSIDTWMFCVNVSFYHRESSPDRYLDGLSDELNYVKDENGNILQVLNIAIASNEDYVGINEETYVYLIAEANINNNSQLFFYSFFIGKDSSYRSESYGWKQLTSVGNNINPKAYVDKTNTLHIFWESDRANSWQVYYGVLGDSYLSVANSVFSSMVDKQAELFEKEVKSIDYISESLIVSADEDAYNPIPATDTENMVNSSIWVVGESNNGSVTQPSTSGYLNNIYTTGNAIDDMAIAFTSIQISEEDRKSNSDNSIPYSQINYQMSFDASVGITQNGNLLSNWDGKFLNIKEIDTLYKDWKEEFDLLIDSFFSNVPIYTKNNNKFTIGRQDNVYDRIVPFCGAYKIIVDPSAAITDFQIKITKEDNNLKDFMFGLMFEKSRFKATNSQTSIEYSIENNDGGYVAKEEYNIYTGRAKLVVFIKTEDINDNRANYIILREFPDTFDVIEKNSYTIIVNYTKVDSGEINNLLNKYNNVYPDRFIGSITLFINDEIKFSQSFISSLTYENNSFDLGFGIPNGGYCIADKMTPSKINVFEDISVKMLFEDILITSPIYTYNSDISNLPDTVRNIATFRVEEDIENPSSTYNFNNSSNLLNLGFRGNEKIIFVDEEEGENGVGFVRIYDVSQIDRVSIEFKTFSVEDRITIKSEYGTTLYDSGMISTILLEGGVISADIDVEFNNSITIEITTSDLDSSWELIAYFKVVYNDNNFLQVPITMEGINRSPSISGGICNDLHFVWQSNLNKYWNIYYSNAVDSLRPFRFDTQITDTESNSIMPSVSVSRNGKRMIVWHDNRNNDFDIYSARSLDGYICDEISCQNKMLDAYDDRISECSLSFVFIASSTANYIFEIEFYIDASLTELFTTIISTVDNSDIWFIDGAAFNSVGSYNESNYTGITVEENQEIVISYTPAKNDDIFDRILYTKLVGETD